MFSNILFASSVLASVFTPALATVVKFAGVNIGGFDFGCKTDVSLCICLAQGNADHQRQGSCDMAKTLGPVMKASADNPTTSGDGAMQMEHFVKEDKMNMFRLPVAWQYLVNSKLGGDLDANNFGSYDGLMQSCLATGAYCIIDIHNYAR